jgi:hypothetical protein
MSVLLIAALAACAWMGVVLAVVAACAMAARGDAAQQQAIAAHRAQEPATTAQLPVVAWRLAPAPERIAASPGRQRQPRRPRAMPTR